MSDNVDLLGLSGALDEIARGVSPDFGSNGSETGLEALANEAPIVRLVDFLLGYAVEHRASDVHFEPFEHEFRIRYRIDGALCELASPPKHLAVPVTSRLKVIADLNIAERRVPQDGRISLTLAGRAVDLRISTLPTQFGESVVLRVLDPVATQLDLAALGMAEDVRKGMEAAIRRPNGIVIVTGPTGAGKTTTLYSCLRTVNTPGVKLLTIEDPVEYEIEGITQVPVNPAAGLTFASALRSFLRQDPDIVMVGEIRDLETAQIAIQASLTGHLVFSTLHTNDAAGAVARLVDMGVEPYLIASSLEAVLAQRLLRRICPHCREATEPSPRLMDLLGEDDAWRAGNFFKGRGCAVCQQTGYKGRVGIFELLVFSDDIRDRLMQGASAQELRENAMEQGMRSLRDDALRAALAGETTLDEVIKYT